MIRYNILNSKKFEYFTDSDYVNVSIRVFEYDSEIYSTTITLTRNIYYFTELSNGWNNKHVIILNLNTNEQISFDIIGIESIAKNTIDKYNKYITPLILSNQTQLCKIMDKFKSDKSNRGISSLGHNYTKYYDVIFNHMRTKEISLFELGLGTNNIEIKSNMGINGVPGASIFGWQEYFINGHIFGADIDTGCLFNTEKIKTFYCDQTNPWIIKQLWDNKYLDFQFDIIIEDGLHTFDANVLFFENSYHKLKKDGIYIIEDINNDEIPNWINIFKEYETKFPQFKFELINLYCDYNHTDNNLIKITLNEI